MLTRRQTVQALGAAGVAAPLLSACSDSSGNRDVADGTDLRLVQADVEQSAGDPGAVAGVVDAVRAFTLDLWAQLPSTGNLALSPYSVAVALAMTANGAHGATARAMNDVLHVDSLATYNAGLSALTQELAALAGPVEVAGKKSEVELSPANQLFGDASIRWRREFLTVLAKMYGAGMRTVDFVGAAERARSLVNGWTAQQTHERIPEILPTGSVDTTTRLVLVDALYLKAAWASPFDRTETTTGGFHRADGTVVDARLMATDDGTASVSGLQFRGARLRYAGGRLAMTVALPTGSEADALRELMHSGLTAQAGRGVHLVMPRWTYRVQTGLKDPLERLGMGVAFGEGADFAAMTTDARLAVSDVLHQTFVAVDEAGTEAAAATAVVMRELGLQVTPEQLVLDRPFLFAVHDTAHGTPLFVGRVADPS
jgi:serine protease inhibitor